MSKKLCNQQSKKDDSKLDRLIPEDEMLQFDKFIEQIN